MMLIKCGNSISCPTLSSGLYQSLDTGTVLLLLGNKISKRRTSVSCKVTELIIKEKKNSLNSALVHNPRGLGSPRELDKTGKERGGKKEHHLWQRRDSAKSGQKALSLVKIVSELPNEKVAVYGALDKWTAWETEFPLIAAVKALKILRKRGHWVRVIQVAKWMLSRGQGATMGTYDTLLLAFDRERRVEEAESLWNMIIHAHTRCVSKRLFSRMIALYDHYDMPEKIIEVFADMEELRVKPDEDTVRRVARAFVKVGQEEKKGLVIKRYGLKWKYVHFNGERVRVRTDAWKWDEDDESTK